MPSLDDQPSTHFDNCWRYAGHHQCAIKEVERLRHLYNELLTEHESLEELLLVMEVLDAEEY